MTVHETARAKMIDCQLRPNKVTDERIIKAFARIRRELFVPEHLRGVAYVDEDLPLGKGRYLMEPMVAARLLQAAMPDRKDTALVVGAGVGYEATLLALLARSVVALEEDAELARLGRAALVDHRIAAVSYVEEPLSAGHRQRAPYDVILFGAVPAPAQTLTEAFAYAYNTNPQLLAQRALLRSTDEQVPQALSNWRPTVTVTGQGGYTRAGLETPNARGAATPTQFFSFVTR